jgi:Carbon-nitrogen hydrolase
MRRPNIEQAAAQGAGLVVLPELFSCGYVPNRAVWDAAEPPQGRTGQWLAATTQRLRICLGAGSAETDGSDLVAAARLEPSRKHYQQQPSFGGWLQPGPWLGRDVIIPFDIAAGRLSYATSRERKRKAQASATRTAGSPSSQPTAA